MLQNDSNFSKTVITGHETWMHHFDPFTKFATRVRKHTHFLPPKRMRQTKSAGKVMMIIYFDYKGVIYHYAMPLKNIVNGKCYVYASV